MPRGINLNSHGWSEGRPVPDRNPWLTKQRMPTPKGLNFLSMFNPFRLGSSLVLATGSARRVTRGYSN